MIKTKKITKEIEVADIVVCNKCGRQLEHDNEEYVSLDKRWGYWSNKKDCTEHQSLICEACYDAFAATFEIPPEVEEVEEYIWGE